VSVPVFLDHNDRQGRGDVDVCPGRVRARPRGYQNRPDLDLGFNQFNFFERPRLGTVLIDQPTRRACGPTATPSPIT